GCGVLSIIGPPMVTSPKSSPALQPLSETAATAAENARAYKLMCFITDPDNDWSQPDTAAQRALLCAARRHNTADKTEGLTYSYKHTTTAYTLIRAAAVRARHAPPAPL